MMERQFAAEPQTAKSDRNSDLVNGTIFTNAAITGAKKKSSQFRRKSVQYTMSEFTEDMSVDSNILTPISGTQQILNAKKSSVGQDESISNIMNHLHGSHISALYNSKELKAEEISLNHFRPYSVIQSHPDGDGQ